MNNVIVAFDFKNVDEAREFLKKFDEEIYIKIGMELFYSGGYEIIKEIKRAGHKIFLDLKLCDIPNTIKCGINALAKLGVDMLNVHCSGGIKMMEYAKEGLIGIKNPPLLIGVTALTSLDDKILKDELLINSTTLECVIKYAQNAKFSGLDGVVCSVNEVEEIHKICGNDFLCVTPGIRLIGDSSDDQKRIASPKFAKECGSDYIVVGRSITTKSDPLSVYKMIKKEFNE